MSSVVAPAAGSRSYGLLRSSTARSPRPGRRMIFGVPVEPLLAIAVAGSATQSSRISAGSSVVASRSALDTTSGGASGQSPSVTLGSATSIIRSRSQAGRSARSGSTQAPSFHAATVEKTCAGELGRPTITRSPWPTPRAFRKPAICSARRSSVAQLYSRSAPSRGAKMIAMSPGFSAARSRVRLPKETAAGSASTMAESLRRPRSPVAGWESATPRRS